MSEIFHYQNGELYAEGRALSALARDYGTPAYVYSRAAIESSWQAYDRAFTSHAKQTRHTVCYAVKANSNLAVLNLLARLGSGFDIVSVGELERVLRAGGDASKVVFSGVGKTSAEMQRALQAGVKCFNVESIAELERLNQVAAGMAVQAPVSIRVNPDVDANTHPYISTGLKENKFGIEFERALEAYQTANNLTHLEPVGIDCHIGSQITDTAPFRDALQRVMALVSKLESEGISIKHIDIGGGLGIDYEGEQVPDAQEYARVVTDVINPDQFEIIMEPGRSIVGNAGILVTQVEYLKPTETHHFAIVDAAMNDLLRPSLYSAWHTIQPVIQRKDVDAMTYDVVGPVCETGDFLGKSRQLSLLPGDFLAVMSAGAYGFTMSSNYNSRPRPVELMVDGDDVHVIREREQIDDLFRGESCLP